MAKVNVLRNVKVEGKWKLLPVARADGRIDWTRVVLQGKAMVPATAGSFHLEYYEDGKRRRPAVGNHMREAKAALGTQEGVLKLRAEGVQTEDAPQIKARKPVEGPTIRALVDRFCASPPVRLRKKSIATYTLALKNFAGWCRKTHLTQLDHTDIEGFLSHQVRVCGLAMGTAVDRGHIIVSEMNRLGAAIRMPKGAWPDRTETEPEVYEPEVLRALFAAAQRREYILFQTFLLTGMREQEVMFLGWEDFNPRRSTLRVSMKPELGFNVKNYLERTVPIPTLLVQLLEEQRAGQKGSPRLIFPTSKHNAAKGQPGGMPNTHMLRLLKALAWKAELNCGHCVSDRKTLAPGRPASCRTHAVCGKFGLHRFRHTYATTLLRDGVDLVSVQKLLGHKDVMSTRKYLHALGSEDLLTKINATSLATAFV